MSAMQTFWLFKRNVCHKLINSPYSQALNGPISFYYVHKDNVSISELKQWAAGEPVFRVHEDAQGRMYTPTSVEVRPGQWMHKDVQHWGLHHLESWSA